MCLFIDLPGSGIWIIDFSDDSNNHYYYCILEKESEISEEISPSNNISSMNNMEVDNSSSIVEDINSIFIEYPSEIESQLDYRIMASDTNEQNSSNNENEAVVTDVTDIIEISDDDENTRQLEWQYTFGNPVANLTGIEVYRNPRNVTNIFPRHRSKMVSIITFLTGKRVNDIVNPHIKQDHGYKLHVRDLLRLLKANVWLNDVIIMNCFSLLIKNRNHIVELEPDIVLGFNRNNNPEIIKHWKNKNSSKNYNHVITPINSHKTHWSLLVIDINQKIVHTLDSFNKIYKNEIISVVKFLEMAIHGSVNDTILQEYECIQEFSPEQKKMVFLHVQTPDII